MTGVGARFGRLAALAAALALAAPAAAAPLSAKAVSADGVSVYQTAGWRRIDQAALIDAAAGADLVLVGEQHDQAYSHAFELRLLEALAARGRPVVLALEMFERDVQPVLDDYLAGRIDEAGFLAAARPWPNYADDYRPLVELARRRGWPVIAANAPRPLAARVAREGFAALDGLGPGERPRAAAALVCPAGPYRARFVEAMDAAVDRAGATAHGTQAPGALQRLYEAQCLKDETMAESALAAIAPGRTVVLVAGQFHTDEAGGLLIGARRRRPDARILTVSIKPAADLAGRPASPELANYVALTP